MNLIPLGWSVLVHEEPPAHATNSGILLANISRLPPCTGRVVAVSAAAHKEFPEITVGRRVHFKPFGGLDFKRDGRHLRLLRREDTLALVDDSPPPA